MSGLKGAQRRAHFICQIVYLDRQVCLSALGLTQGLIIEKPRGRGGFGYDPPVLRTGTGKNICAITAGTEEYHQSSLPGFA